MLTIECSLVTIDDKNYSFQIFSKILFKHRNKVHSKCTEDKYLQNFIQNLLFLKTLILIICTQNIYNLKFLLNFLGHFFAKLQNENAHPHKFINIHKNFIQYDIL